MAKLINPPKATAANIPTEKIVTIGTIIREFAPPRDKEPTINAFQNLVELLGKKPTVAEPTTNVSGPNVK
jgi:hypothetical protein